MTTKESDAGKVKRATGLLVIEVINSNPNGDPDRESDPRQRPDGHGEISPVSFKRKLRDLLAERGPVWVHIQEKLGLKPEEFEILETRNRGFAEIKDAGKAWAKVVEMLDEEDESHQVRNKYWDARVFGATFLEKGEDAPQGKDGKKDRKYIRTGVVQFGLGLSVAPISIRRLTTTKMASAQKGHDRGMAPLGYRVVEHAVYCMPFFVNPNLAHKSGCTSRDIDVLQGTIPYAYSDTRSVIRTTVEIRHAWYIEHKSPLGSCSDFAILAALTPKKLKESDKPSKSWGDYDEPKALPLELQSKVAPLRDLMAESYETSGT